MTSEAANHISVGIDDYGEYYKTYVYCSEMTEQEMIVAVLALVEAVEERFHGFTEDLIADLNEGVNPEREAEG